MTVTARPVARTLPAWASALALATGVACVAIGVAHVAFGLASEPGLAGLGATVDSRERFYGAVFAGYGLAWVWAVRGYDRPRAAVRVLALVMFAGGLARLLSIAVEGWPHWFQVVLTVVELVLPPVFLVAGGRSRGAEGSVPPG